MPLPPRHLPGIHLFCFLFFCFYPRHVPPPTTAHSSHSGLIYGLLFLVVFQGRANAVQTGPEGVVVHRTCLPGSRRHHRSCHHSFCAREKSKITRVSPRTSHFIKSVSSQRGDPSQGQRSHWEDLLPHVPFCPHAYLSSVIFSFFNLI